MRHLFIATTLAVTTALSPLAFAQGGDDPMPGIDIIIKKDPSSRPIVPGRFGEKEIGLTYGAGTEKLNGRLNELVAQTLANNADVLGKDARMDSRTRKLMMGASKTLGAEIKDGSGGSSSFTYPAADGRSKLTITFHVTGDDYDFYRIEGHVGKAAPADLKGNIDYFEDQDRLERGNDGSFKSNIDEAFIRRAAPVGCVTEAGAVDANCDGVADAAAAVKSKR